MLVYELSHLTAAPVPINHVDESDTLAKVANHKAKEKSIQEPKLRYEVENSTQQQKKRTTIEEKSENNLPFEASFLKIHIETALDLCFVFLTVEIVHMRVFEFLLANSEQSSLDWPDDKKIPICSPLFQSNIAKEKHSYIESIRKTM